MTSIYSERENKYDDNTHAEALFFHSSDPKHPNVKGLRVLLPDKDLEFSDNSYIGTDPSGTFYYNTIEETKGATKYESDTIMNHKKNHDQLCAWVKFYNSSDKLVGEFIGNDYFRAVELAGMKGHKASGSWKDSSAKSFVEAHLSKNANSATVTLDISNAIKKKATITTDDYTLKSSSISDISGKFHYENLDDINKGTFVSYTNDRLVFYQDDVNSRTFTGYYIPNGRSDTATILGIQGNSELTLKDTKWTATS